MLMRKKSVPCKQNTQCQARVYRRYPNSDKNGQNLYICQTKSAQKGMQISVLKETENEVFPDQNDLDTKISW